MLLSMRAAGDIALVSTHHRQCLRWINGYVSAGTVDFKTDPHTLVAESTIVFSGPVEALSAIQRVFGDRETIEGFYLTITMLESAESQDDTPEGLTLADRAAISRAHETSSDGLFAAVKMVYRDFTRGLGGLSAGIRLRQPPVTTIRPWNDVHDKSAPS